MNTIETTMVVPLAGAVDSEILNPNYDMQEVIATTDFALEKNGCNVTGLGALCADSMRAVCNSMAAWNFGTVDISVIGTGTIRDGIYPNPAGTDTDVSFTDAYNALPLGMSAWDPNFIPGYPVMSIYATGAEIWAMCEAGLTYSKLMGCEFYLNFSGLQIVYNPATAVPGVSLGVQAVYLYDADDTWCLGTAGGFPAPALINPLDDTKLYHVAVGLYELLMMDVLKDSGLVIIPKNAEGVPIDMNNWTAALYPYRFDAFDNGADGIKDGLADVQELKQWMAIVEYLKGLPGGPQPPIPDSVYGPGGALHDRLVILP